MTRFRLWLVAVALGTGACTQTFDATSLGVPATMAMAPGDTTRGTPFRSTAHTVHGLFGLVTVSQANLRKSLARQLVGGEGISNLKIRTKSGWLDVLVTGITLGLIVPRTVVYTGVITGR
ncbi:MAG TPA: hypothetical protein VLB00_13020 [Gemmatimonadales bacterium]|nr:hypothetical protein [Gemmatimonadales bacterium]